MIFRPEEGEWKIVHRMALMAPLRPLVEGLKGLIWNF
jgi:hypothetical protein